MRIPAATTCVNIGNCSLAGPIVAHILVSCGTAAARDRSVETKRMPAGLRINPPTFHIFERLQWRWQYCTKQATYPTVGYLSTSQQFTTRLWFARNRTRNKGTRNNRTSVCNLYRTQTLHTPLHAPLQIPLQNSQGSRFEMLSNKDGSWTR